MKDHFLPNLVRQLQKNGFDFLDPSSVDPRFFAMKHQIGATLNVCIVIEAKKFESGSLTGFVEACCMQYRNAFGQLDLKNIFAVFVLITEDDSSRLGEVQAILNNAEDFLEQEVYPIFWEIRMNEDGYKFSYNQKQPDEVCKINRSIFDAYHLEMNEVVEEEKEQKEDTVIVTYVLILLIVLIYALMELNGGSTNTENLVQAGALVPDLIINQHEYYRMLTSVFLHIGFLHLLSNSFALYLFGRVLEIQFGRVRFLVLYLLSGLAGSVSSVLINPSISAGASGAVYGLMGATAAVCFFKPRGLWFFNLYNISLFILGGLAVSALIPYVNNVAHIGGLIFGFIIGLIFCLISNPNTD